MMLTNTDALLTLAEVSATFAGFAALVTLFVHRRMEAAAAHDLLRLRLVIGASIVVVMAALIPVSIAGLGLPQTLVWQLSSAIFLTLIYFVIRSFIRSYRTVRGSFPPPSRYGGRFSRYYSGSSHTNLPVRRTVQGCRRTLVWPLYLRFDRDNRAGRFCLPLPHRVHVCDNCL